MDRSTRDSNRAALQPGDPCPSCGGSGVLRTDGVSYRTCLDCLGQGAQPDFRGSGLIVPGCTEPAEVLAGRRLSRGFRGDLTAWTSAAR